MTDSIPPKKNASLEGFISPPLRKRRIVPIVNTAPPESRLRQRKVTFRKADVARALSAAAKAGLVATSVEITPDGLIRIISAPGKPSGDLFNEWSDRL